MRKLLCMIGIHEFKTIDCTDCFNTNYTDKNWIIKHMVWYQKCSCCGKRRLKDTVKKDSIFTTRHNGIEYARVNWVENDVMYLGSGIVTEPPIKKPKLTVVDGGKNA